MNKLKNYIAFALLLSSICSQAQVVVPTPAGTTISPAPAGGSTAFGNAGGLTYQYTNAGWPAFTSPCTYYGFTDTLYGAINGYSTDPSCVLGNDNMILNLGSSNLAGGIVVYTGTTNYKYVDGGGSFTIAALSTRVTIKFTTLAAVAIPLISTNSKILIKANQNFNVNELVESFSPASALYSSGGPNTWTPSIDLYNELHTDPSAQICTSYNQSKFYTMSVTATASSTSPYCTGDAIKLSSTGAAQATGGVTYSWSGPSAYTNGTQNPTIAGATVAMAGTYTMTVKDAQSCPGTATTVVAVSAPGFTGCPSNISTNVIAGTCAATATWTPPTLSGTCAATVTSNYSPGASFPTGVTTVTYTATAGSGTTGTCSFTVTVVDNISPAIACPANISVNAPAGTCAAVVNFVAPVGTDNCGGVVTTRTAGLASGSSFPVGVTTETYKATDASANTTTCSFTITVVDNQAPVITCPANISVNAAAGTCAAVVNFVAPVGTDNCGGVVTTRTAGLASGSSFPVGVTTETFSATDASFNVTTCSFTITVVDNQAPVIACPANISVNATAGACAAVVNFVAPFGTDNCSGVVTTQTAGLASGSTFPVGVTTETFTATDASTNVTTCSFTITVVDNQAPVIACPANITVNATAGTCAAVVNFVPPVGTDNCSGVVTTQTAGLASGSTFPVGVTTQTFKATDASSNATTCSFTITVVDNQAPVIACPANISVNAAAGTCAAVVNFVTPVGTDNCSGVVTTQTAGLASGSAFPVGVTTQTFKATDASSNATTCSFTITVVDNQAPVIACPANITVNATAGTCAAVVNFVAPVGTDNCSGVVTIQTAGLASGSTFPVGVTTETFKATDASANVTTCSFTITVVDNQAPVISCPANISVNAAAGTCAAVVNFVAPVGTDNCSGVVTTQTAGLVSGSTFPVGVTTQTFKANDASSNVTTCSFNITVIDNQAPVIACPANISVNATAGTCAAVVNFVAPVGTDNCGGVVTTQTAGLASGSTFPVGVTTQTFKATDASSNITTCSFTITVVDNQPPVIACPSNISVNNDAGQCGAVVTFTPPVGTDNCSGVVTTQTAGLASGSTFPIGITTQTFTATDASSNVTSCSFTIKVSDTELPVLACPINIYKNSDPGTCGAVINFVAPVGTDNCPGVVTTQTAGLASGALFPVGATIQTYTATDASNNVTTCSFTITVTDVEFPVIACPGNISVNNDPGQCGAVVTFTPPVGTDNCAVSTAQTAGLPSGSSFPVGVTTQTFTATDASGNAKSCSFTITVIDIAFPAIACPANISVNNDAGQCGAVVVFTPPVGTDNCAVVTTQTAGLASGSSFPVGVTTQTFTATDASGNATSCSFTITVTDNAFPVIACPANINVNNDAGLCGAVVTFSPPVGTDNCAVATTQTAGLASGALFPVGVTTQTFTATDASGNATSCSFTVTVLDAEPPALACPGNISVNNDPGTCGAVVNFVAPVGTDNCSGVVTTQTAGLVSGSTFPVGVTTQTYTATDASGNATSCSFTITVNDIQFPVIACPANISVNNDAGQCGAVVTFTPPVGTDNCAVTTTQTAGLPSGSSFPVGVTTQTYTATDASGNATSCSFTITVVDNQAPVIACPASISVNTTPGLCGAAVNFTAPVGTDNCAVVTTQTAGLASGATFPVGVTTQTYTATDASNNVTSCSFTVTVKDMEFPVIACPANITVNATSGLCGAAVTFTPPVGTDNCAVFTAQTAGLASGATFPVGVTTETFTATDASNNVTSCSFTITVVDNQPPVITCPANISVNATAGTCAAVVNFVAPVGTDNCSGVVTTQTAGLPSGSTFPVGVTTQTFTATDASNNVTSCSFTITVVDNQSPVIACPANISVNATAGTCGAVVNFVAPVGTDNCSGVVTTQTAGLASGSLFPVGVTTQTFTATDASNNATSCSFTITVVDNQAPVIACPANISANTTPGICGAAVTFTAPVGTDNCSVVTTQTAGLASGATFPVGVTTQTFTATDASNNVTSCSFTVTVTDMEFPVIACPANITVNAAPGQCGAAVTFTAPVGTDNCAVVTTQTAGLASGATFPVGFTTQTFTATDASNNATSCSFTITVLDAEPPVITCPANISVNSTPGICGAVVTFVPPVGTDNCSGVVTTQTAGLASGATFPVGMTMQTFTATDASNNITSCSFTVTVLDVEPPVIACPANISVNSTPGICGAAVTFVPPVGTDNCSGVVTTQTAGLASGATFPVGVTTQTFTATDASNNVTSCSFTVTVKDMEFPVIACPANISVNTTPGLCGAAVTFSPPVGTDNCAVVTTQTAGLASGATFPVGVTTQTFTATDASNNVTSCSFTVTVLDAEPPVIACPANIAVNSTPGICGAVVTFVAPVGTDNCSGAVTTQTAGLASGATFPVGVTTQTFTATDASNNVSTCSFTVTVKDIEFPVIACPANINVTNDAGQCGAVVTFTPPVGTDNCSGVTTSQTSGLPSGTMFPIGTTTQGYQAIDASGNTTSCSFTVTVTDLELPVITCNADMAVNNTVGQCGAIVTFTPPTGTDNCTGAVTAHTSGLPSGSLFPIGMSTETYTVTDASGNVASCSFHITVTDNESPVVNCTSNISACDNGSNIISYTVPTGTDNCSTVTVSQTAGLVSGSAFPIGVTTNTYTFTDASGNTTTCSFTVTIHPTPVVTLTAFAPVCEGSGIITLTNGSPAGGTYSGPGVVNNTFNPSLTGTGTFTIVYTATLGTCSASTSGSITVQPKPVVTLNPFNSVAVTAGPFALTGGTPSGGTYSGSGVSLSNFNPAAAGVGVHVITYVVANAFGCADSASATIEVIDESGVIVYNAFTPNNDGVDDYWTIKNIDKFSGNTVVIFNRWGGKVYEATNYNNDWIGADLPQATYYYIVDLNNGSKKLTGTVTLIR
jgi:gliding motility-associated-like protein